MENKLTKKYGLFTAICMVVGIVIGSGIFFKAQDVLKETAGDALMGVLAWLIGGAVMAVLAVTFGVMATKYERSGGAVDYAEATCGKTYAYFLGWFMATIYYPAMTSVLAWVSARYTMVAVMGVSSASATALFSPETITTAAFYLVAIFFMNAVAPKLAGKFQVSTTVIKLIPIFFIAIIGTIIGLANGTLIENFNYVKDALPDTVFPGTSNKVGTGNLFAAVCCTVFAYEGWVIATAINSEIKNAKKNLPLALGIGAAVIVVAYALYYLGVLGLEEIGVLGKDGTSAAFSALGNIIATTTNFLIIVSCLGTLNGLMLGCTRGFHALAIRNEGIAPETLAQVDKKTNMPNNSAVYALLFCGIWFAYFIGGQFLNWFHFYEGVDLAGEAIWKVYAFDSSELPVVTIYPLYIPILAVFMVKAKDVHWFKRFVLPALSIIGACVIVVASGFRHKMANIWYLIVFAIFMAIGALFYRWNGKKSVIDMLGDFLKAKFGKGDADEEAEEETPESEAVAEEA